MQYVILLFLIILGILKRNSKFIFSLQIIWLIVLIGANTLSPDIGWLEYEFINATSHISLRLFTDEGIYELMQYLCRNVGMNFRLYLMLMAVISIGLIVNTICFYLKENRCFAMSMIMIYPLMQLIIQVNNRTAIAIILFGSRYIMKKNWKGNIQYLLYVLLAMGFHTSALFYIILLPCAILKIDKIKAMVTGLALIAIIIIPILPIIVEYIASNSARVNDYFANEELSLAWYKAIGLAVWQICGFIIMYFIMNHKFVFRIENFKIGKNDKKRYNLSEMFLKMGMMMLLVCFLYYYNYIFSRLWRYFFPLMYIGVGYNLSNKKEKKNGNGLAITLTCAYALASSLYFDFLWGNNYILYRTVQENNWIFKLCKIFIIQ